MSKALDELAATMIEKQSLFNGKYGLSIQRQFFSKENFILTEILF